MMVSYSDFTEDWSRRLVFFFLEGGGEGKCKHVVIPSHNIPALDGGLSF